MSSKFGIPKQRDLDAAVRRAAKAAARANQPLSGLALTIGDVTMSLTFGVAPASPPDGNGAGDDTERNPWEEKYGNHQA
jgi:hypothetical protein